MRLFTIVALAVMPAVLAVGCSGAGDSGGTMTSPTPASSSTSPAVATVTISIVATSGASSYSPNPAQAETGASLVWRNNDQVAHQIAMDDGSGTTATIAPGASSAPIALRTAAGTYHCTIHPAMVGSINGASAPAPPAGGGSDY